MSLVKNPKGYVIPTQHLGNSRGAGGEITV